MKLRVERWDNETKPDAEVLRQRLRSEGYNVTECTDEPGTVHAPHSHNEDQTHWILAGGLEFTVEGETYVMYAGDRDFLPADTIHSAVVSGNEAVRYLIGVRFR